MAKQFSIPRFYRSEFIDTVKRIRREGDPRKSDLTATVIDTPKISIRMARHFGFCYGVENAIEIAYRALEENVGRRVFLLSEMIHNRQVNADLQARGVEFLMRTDGTRLRSFDTLTPEDVVIIPAFGTTTELFDELESRGVRTTLYNATCPFVEKVWKRGFQLAEQGYTIVIHGKHSHEETRATFSHVSRSGTPSIVVRDREEALTLAQFIRGELPESEFATRFDARFSPGFSPGLHLARLGVVNQTTMLAEETEEITEILREAVRSRFGALEGHFADTRDTLCYATSENQRAIRALVESGGDLGLIVGGYNSSNSSHLVEICEERVPTYYIDDAAELLDAGHIRHFDMRAKRMTTTSPWLTAREGRISSEPLLVLLSAGASCPDSVVARVVERLVELVHPELVESSSPRFGPAGPSRLVVLPAA